MTVVLVVVPFSGMTARSAVEKETEVVVKVLPFTTANCSDCHQVTIKDNVWYW